VCDDNDMNAIARQLDMTPAFSVFSRNGIRRASLFGSYAKGVPTEKSDVDLLIEFEPGRIPDLFEFIGIKHDLERSLGRPVDLVMRDALNKYLRDEILSSAKEIYAQK
jgi:predicted nucleotidyltransferase